MQKTKGIWDEKVTQVAQALAYEGFTHRVIAKECSLGVGATGYRLAKLGISTADQRAGHSEQSKDRIHRILHRYGMNGHSKNGRQG